MVDRPNREWFGVGASQSARSLMDAVHGLLVSSRSTIQVIAIICSSLNEWHPSTFHIAFLFALTRPYQTPLMCGTPGWLKAHLILSLAAFSSTWVVFLAAKRSWNFPAPPPKFVPLSDRIFSGQLRVTTNWWMAPWLFCVPSVGTSSKWTGRVLKDVNRQIYIKTVFRKCFTWNESK